MPPSADYRVRYGQHRPPKCEGLISLTGVDTGGLVSGQGIASGPPHHRPRLVRVLPVLVRVLVHTELTGVMTLIYGARQASTAKLAL